MSSPTRKTQVTNVIQVSSGNFLEMYDFMAFGYFASAIGETYFPTGDHFASLMSSLMTFGVGFLMRPIGALILGAYIDRYGRRAGLILTLALMSVGTFGLAFTPGFAVIGIAAPLFIVFSRLLQGFSAGVELGGVSVYLAELATPGHKGFYVSWQSASQQAAVMFTALLGVVRGAMLPVQAMEQWGWRIPFLIGCLIIPVLFLLRRYLPETEAFRVRKHRPSEKEVWRTLIRNWSIVLIGVMLVTMTTVSFYLITAYTPTALFGGFTPAICESLIKATGNRAMPGLWMSTAAAIGLVATLLIIRRQKRGVQESTDGALGTVERGSPNA